MKPSFTLNIMIIYNFISLSSLCLIGRSMHPLAGKYRYSDIFFRENYLFREANSSKDVNFEGQITFKDNYPSMLFLKSNKVIVFLYPSIIYSQHAEF